MSLPSSKNRLKGILYAYLDPNLLKRLKMMAVEQGVRLSALVERLLTVAIQEKKK